MSETKIYAGNAPCSWGTLEFEGLEGDRVEYEQMLNELVETGYTGTELGDWGFMPTEPAALGPELDGRQVEMWGAFVAVKLEDPTAHAEGEARAVKIAQLMAEVSIENTRHPFLVLACENGADPVRTQNVGRVTPQMSLSDSQWQTFTQGANQIAGAVRDKTGLRTVFHHHCAGYVETPDEIDRLLELTDPTLLGLVFDTGHFAFGAGEKGCSGVLDGLNRFNDRIWYIHFKDCQPDIAQQSRVENWDYFKALHHGVFCELGQGCVDFPAVLAWMRQRGDLDRILVEQDVLPGMGSPKASARRNRDYLRSIGV